MKKQIISIVMAAALVISEMVCGLLPVSYVAASENQESTAPAEVSAEEISNSSALQQSAAGGQDPGDLSSGETALESGEQAAGSIVMTEEPVNEQVGIPQDTTEMPQMQSGSAEEIEVCFELNGLGNTIESVRVLAGSLLEKPEDPVAEGYHFAGWYADPELTIPWDFAVNTVTGAVTLYARWEKAIAAEGSTAGEINTDSEQNIGSEVGADGEDSAISMIEDTEILPGRRALSAAADSSEDTSPENEKEEAEAEEELLTEKEPEIVVMTDGVAGNGSVSQTWGSDLMNLTKTKEDAQAAIDQGLINTSVTVAVIDTGVNAGHEWLSGRIAPYPLSRSFIHEDDDNYNDENGHGTHVAGIIAKNTPSNVKLMILQALDAEKKGTAADVVAAIKYAVENGARIINLSMGVSANDFEDPAEYSDYVTQLDTALAGAENAGVVVIVSAGNAGTDIDASGAFPAGSSHVITVSAIDENKNKYASSNYGNAVDFCAPGVDIHSAWIGGSSKYEHLNGTSMAVPFISAAYALEMLGNESLSAGQVTGQLIACANNADANAYLGYGCPYIDVAYNSEDDTPVRPVIKRISNTNVNNIHSITLTWDALEGTVYNVYRRTDEDEAYTLLGVSDKGEYRDRDIVAGVTYTYYIEASESDYYSILQSEEKAIKAWVSVESIRIEPYSTTKLFLVPDESVQLQIAVTPGNATDPNVSWKSTDETVVHVDENGLVTAVGLGSAKIEAVSNDGKKQSYREIQVSLYENSCGEEVFWHITKDNEECILTISGHGEMYDYNSFTKRPWEEEYSESITKIVIEEGITAIGEYAFAGLSNLRIVEGGEDVLTIGGNAFRGCSGLLKIEGFNKTEVLGGEYSSSGSVFENCSGLKYVNGFASLKTMGWNTFKGCSSLEEVEGMEKLVTIQPYSFYGCSSLKSFDMPDSLETLGRRNFIGCTALSSVTISNKLKTIPEQTFEGCASIQEVVLPEGIENIEKNAFKNCSALESITFSSGLKTIGDFAFVDCSNLRTIYFAEGLQSIGEFSFSGCSSLYNPEFPDSLKSIGGEAFENCKAITELNLPAGLEKIDYFAFLNCDKVTSIELPEAIQYIGSGAFSGMKIKTIKIPDGLEDLSNCYGLIGEYDWGLEEYQVSENNQALSSEDGVLFNKEKTVLIAFPDGKTGTYIIPESVEEIGHLAFFTSHIDKVSIPEAVKVIGYSAFARSELIEEMVIPEGVRVIPYMTFFGCKSLKTLHIPNTVTEIGESAFSGCDGLTEVMLPGVEMIGVGAFSGCDGLTEVMLPGAKTIGDSAFSSCRNLKTVECGENVKDIGAGSFAFDYLASISLPVSLENNKGAFARKGVYTDVADSGVEKLIINGFTKQYRTNTALSGDAILSKSDLYINASGKLNDLTWHAEGPSGDLTLTISGSGPMPDFKSASEAPWYGGKDEIRRIVIEDGVTHVGSYAFYQYDQIEEITLPSTVTGYGWSVFRGIPNLETFHYYVEDPSAPGLDISVQYLVAKYSGNTYEPDVRVVHSTDGELIRGTDFEVTYKGTRNKGNGLITVTFLNEYATFGSWCVPFIVDSSYLKGENIKAFDSIVLDESSLPYDGRVKEPGATVRSGQWKLKLGADYTLEYAPGRINVGSYPVKAIGIGVYSECKSIEAVFEITVLDIKSLASRASLSKTSYTFDGTPHTPRLSVAGLREDKDYTVSYSNEINAGTAYAKAVGKAPNCTGEITLPFVIEEAPQKEPADTGSKDNNTKDVGIKTDTKGDDTKDNASENTGTKNTAAEKAGVKNTGTKDTVAENTGTKNSGTKDDNSGNAADGQTSGKNSTGTSKSGTGQNNNTGTTGNNSGSLYGQSNAAYYSPGVGYYAGGANDTAVFDEPESGMESAEDDADPEKPDASKKAKMKTGKEAFSKKKTEEKAESTAADEKSGSGIPENSGDVSEDIQGAGVPTAVKGTVIAAAAAVVAVILFWRKKRKNEE